MHSLGGCNYLKCNALGDKIRAKSRQGYTKMTERTACSNVDMHTYSTVSYTVLFTNIPSKVQKEKKPTPISKLI